MVHTGGYSYSYQRICIEFAVEISPASLDTKRNKRKRSKDISHSFGRSSITFDTATDRPQASRSLLPDSPHCKPVACSNRQILTC
nr:hypothetical protein Iba_chr12aCG8250 [Ipomoea batatas]